MYYKPTFCSFMSCVVCIKFATVIKGAQRLEFVTLVLEIAIVETTELVWNQNAAYVSQKL